MEDPVEFAGRRLQNLSTRGGESIQDEERRAKQESTERFVVADVVRLHAGCLAAGRAVSVQTIATMAFQASEKGRAPIEFDHVVLKARQARQEMGVWLDEAAVKGEDVSLLCERLTSALAKSPGLMDPEASEPAR